MTSLADIAKIISPKFTEEVLLEISRKKSKFAHVNIRDVKLGSVLQKGEAYLSQVSRVTINASGHNGSGDDVQEFQVHIIVKSIPKSLTRVKTFRSFDFFENETAFYETVWPALQAFQKSKNIPEPYEAIPLCLATFADGANDFIVLEDVSFNGYAPISRSVACDLELSTFILKHFAKFHAVSVAYRDQNPSEFQRISDCIQESYFVERLRNWYKGAMERYDLVAKDAVKKELPPSYLEKLNEVTSRDLYGECCRKLAEDSKLRAVSHGDCWGPNLLIRGSNKDRDMILIDFQLMRYTSVAADILFLIYTCVDPAVRNKHWDYLLQQYYESFSDMMTKLGSTSVSFQALKEEIQRYGICGYLICVDALIMSVLDEDDVIDIDEVTGDEEIPIHEIWVINPIQNVENRKRVADFVKHVIDNKFI